MSRKFTLEEVSKLFTDEGYSVLSKEYINSCEKLRLICPKGHEIYMNVDGFKQGDRCRKCADEANKHTYEYVKCFIESIGYMLLSETYAGVKDKLDLICENGHKISMSFNTLNAGRRCKYCFYERETLTYDFVKNEIEKQGDTLLSNNYVNANEKLNILCHVCHRDYWMNYANFSHGFRCTFCPSKQLFKFEFVKEYIESCGDILLSTEYVRSSENLDIQCGKCGNIWHPCFNAYRNTNSRCPKCIKITLSEKLRMDMSVVRKIYKEHDFEILDSDEVYINSATKLNTKCLKCGKIWFTTYSNIRTSKCGCPICGSELRRESVSAASVTEDYNFLVLYPDIAEEWDYFKNNKPPESYAPKSEFKVWWICKQCNYSWEARISDRVRGNGCKVCGMSGGCKRIYYNLLKYNVEIELEYEFQDLLSDLGNPLRYDFGISDSNKLLMLIEFDHIQHEKYIPYFHKSLERFERYQYHDLLKTEYAKNNNIPLLRINQHEFNNIESILSKELYSLGKEELLIAN